MKHLFLSFCLVHSLFFPSSATWQSQDLSRQINAYMKQERSIQSILFRLTNKIDSYLSRFQVFELGKVYLQAEQNHFPHHFDEELLEKQLHDYSNETIHLEKLQTIRSDYQKQIEDVQAKKEQLIKLQQQLFLEHPELRGFSDQGEKNDQSMLKGTYDLPAFGSIGHIQEEGTSCLAMVDAHLIEPSSGWSLPFMNGFVSAGTWSYPQGGLHLGLDYALDMHSSLYAPANGIILYADAPSPEDGGYLGNWCGWPAGAGNSICMLVKVKEQYYAVTFAHLSSTLFIRAGQSVQQGDLLALSGNSGNSTGPHCHVEVFSLTTDVDSVVNYFMEGADFSFGNGWDQPDTCSAYACRIRPESVF